MRGKYEMRCQRCGVRWSVSSQRNSNNTFVCPECAEKQARILRHNKPVDYGKYQVIAIDTSGFVTYGGRYATN